MDPSDEGTTDEPASMSSDAEAAAIRIVSNLPAALRGTPDEVQANPSGSVDAEARFWEDESDEDCDEDEDIDIGELAEDMAVLEEELEHGAWEGPAPAGFPDYLHDAYLGLGHELDPDNDVGLYEDDDDDEGFISDDFADLEDTEDEEDWDEEWGPAAGNEFARNLIHFRHVVAFPEHRHHRTATSALPPELQIPPFWGEPHDESDEEYADSADEEENPEQESFFSRAGQSDSQWFQLSAASNHFQSADSLATGGTPSCSSIQGSQDEEIVMLHNNFCLALWRLPAAPAAASSAACSAAASASASTSAPNPKSAAPLDPAAAASSSAATSTSKPASIPPTAEAGISAATSASSQPSQPDEESRDAPSKSPCGPTPISAEADAVLLAFTYPRYRIYSIARSPDGRFVAVGGHAGLVSIYEVAVNPDHESLTPPTPPTSPPDKPADPQLRAHTLAHSGKDTHRDKCPLLLQLVTHIALENISGVVKAASMANSVRFGLVGGKMRLLVACQNGGVFLFEVGPGPLDSASQGMPCQEVLARQEEEEAEQKMSPRSELTFAHFRHSSSEEVLFMSDQQLSDMQHKATVDPAPPGEWGPFSSPADTVVLRNYLVAASNCAVASPDGNWIAVVGDAPSLTLLHLSEVYAVDVPRRNPVSTDKSSVLSFGAKQPRRTSRSNPRHTGRSAGSQYCCWNSDSTLVALSSDFYQAVMVFDVHRKQQVLRFEDQPTACLPVTFAPWDPHLLIFAEAVHHVYITDLRNVSQARQRLAVSADWHSSQLSSANIRGLAVTPGGRLLVAHSDRLVQWNFLRNWVPEEHRCYPARLKEAAALLLLAAAANPGSASPRDTGLELGLHSLPKEVLLRIIGLSAFPLGMWMTGLPKLKTTEGLPEKPLSLETLQEQHHVPKS